MCPRRWICSACVILLALSPPPAAAQDANSPEELRRSRDEAIAQLKTAQDRKNELAAENEKLQARLAEVEKRLADRDREAAAWAERTWFYRSHYAAWERFLSRYPRLREQWRAFLAMNELDPLNGMPEVQAESGFTRSE
jgi:hypothetical protein